jgi:WD40 repeat protein
MVNVRQFPAVGLILLLSLAWVIWVSQPARGSEELMETRIELPDIGSPQFAVGDHSHRAFRSLVVSRDLASVDEGPIVILAGKHEVYYYDSDIRTVISARLFGEYEYPTVSQNGKFIAVMSRLRNRRTGRYLWKMRIEDWSGRRLWEMDYRPSGPLEPTPDGGFVAYPTLHPKEALDWDPDPSAYPPKVPHGLLVYDNRGRLVLEGVGFEESRTLEGLGKISPDGQYLAFIFRWIPEDIRSERGVGMVSDRDRACLVLYDLREGKELWRRFFRGSQPTHIVLSPGAERIICSVSTAVVERLQDADYHLYVLDRDGQSVAELPIETSLRTSPPRGLNFSPDWSLAAFLSADGRISVLRVSDGGSIGAWQPPSDVRGVGSFEVDDSGRVVAFGTTGEYGTSNRKHWLFSSDPIYAGTERLEIPDVSAGAGVEVISYGGALTVWMKARDSVRVLSRSGDPDPDGGGR